MKIKIGFIFVLVFILIETSIIFNVKSEKSEDTVECFSVVEECREDLHINDIIKEIEDCNIKLLNITNENGEYLINVSINEDKELFIERIQGLNNFIIKDYELKWKENMVDATFVLKYNTVNEL